MVPRQASWAPPLPLHISRSVKRLAIRSKLPQVGTTIFTIMSRRAAELQAVNLGQGFPDYDIDPRLGELVHEAMLQGHNQYAPMHGMPQLRQAIADKLTRSYAIGVDPDNEITVTLGATEAIFSAVQALVGPGDEVIVFDPCYDSYQPAAQLAGAACVHVPLQPPFFRYDWERIQAAVTARTRLLIVNSPLNPGCTCMTAEDLAELAALLRNREIYLISDEVYEHIVFDGRQHHSVLSSPELRARSVAVYSFGKTLSATGLRVGYGVAAPDVTTELRKVHQFNTFTIATALQVAIANYLNERPEIGDTLAPLLSAKRDRLVAALNGSGLTLRPAEGSFFQLIDYGALSQIADIEFADELLTRAGVASIPLSVFYQYPPAMTLLRLCFAKRDATLDEGAMRLCEYLRRSYQA
jgi:methionine aminotransferase